MSEKKQRAAACCCGEKDKDRSCPCKKRICLPILGLAGLALLVSVAAKRRKRQ